jgi:hypothetical protein
MTVKTVDGIKMWSFCDSEYESASWRVYVFSKHIRQIIFFHSFIHSFIRSFMTTQDARILKLQLCDASAHVQCQLDACLFDIDRIVSLHRINTGLKLASSIENITDE